MNELSTKVALGVVLVLIIVTGAYWYSKSNQTPVLPQTSNIVTPEQLATEDTLKAGVTYRDDQSGYEFTPFEDMSYTRQEWPRSDSGENRSISLLSDTGQNPTTNKNVGWPRIALVGRINLTASEKIPVNYDLLTAVKKRFVPTEFADPLPSSPNCEINNTPCVKISYRSSPQAYATEEIYLVTKGYLLNIQLNDPSTKEARDYYAKFLSGFKVLSGTN